MNLKEELNEITMQNKSNNKFLLALDGLEIELRKLSLDGKIDINLKKDDEKYSILLDKKEYFKKWLNDNGLDWTGSCMGDSFTYITINWL